MAKRKNSATDDFLQAVKSYFGGEEPTLNQLLGLLPQKKDNIYYGLRKMDNKGEVEWVCACVNMQGNLERANNIGPTPEIAVGKMLVRLGTLRVKEKE